MAVVENILINLASDLIANASSFLYSDLDTNVKWKVWKKQNNLTRKDDIFVDAYAEALIRLKEEGKPNIIINFFSEKSVINTVRDFWYDVQSYESSINQMLALGNWFQLDENNEVNSLDEEVNEFLKVFKNVVNVNRTPSEAELFKNILKIQQYLESKNEKQDTTFITNYPKLYAGDFIGRKKEISTINEILKEKDSLAIIGIGGIGKTTITLGYLNNYHTHYKNIIWVNSDNNIVNAIAFNNEIADYLNIPLIADESDINRFKRINAKLNNLEGPNIIVLDNLEKKDLNLEIRSNLLGPPNWKILITSREEIPGLEIFRVDSLTIVEARILFAKFHNIEKHKLSELNVLLKSIQFHTLTIEIFAKLLNKMHPLVEVVDLIRAVNQKGLKNPKIQEPIWTRYSEENNVYTHLIKAFELSNISDKEKWILKQFIAIPSDWYSLKEINDLIGGEKHKINKALNSLAEKGWLNKNEGSEFNMHRMVKVMMEHQLVCISTDITTLIDSIIKHLSSDILTNIFKKNVPYLPYALSISRIIEDTKTPKILTLYNRGVEIALYISRIDFAEILVKKIKDAIIPENKRDSSEIIWSYNTIASTEREVGNYSAALQYHRKILKLLESSFCRFDILINTFHNYASTLNTIGQHKEAIEFNLKALDIAKNNYPENSPEVAISVQNLAISKELIGEYSKSLELHLYVIEILNKNLIHENLFLANSYNRMALAAKNMSFYKESLYYHLKAFNIYVTLVDKNHPIMGNFYEILALTCSDIWEDNKALDLHHKALEIFALNYKKDDIRIANSYINIGQTNYELNNFQDSLKYSQLALGVYSNKLVNHINLATIYNNIGLTYVGLEKYQEAINNYVKAKDILLDSEEANPHYIGRLYNNIAHCYSVIGLHNKAIIFYKKSILQLQEYIPEDHLDFVKAFNNIAESYIEIGEMVSAHNYFKKCLIILQKNPDSHKEQIIFYEQKLRYLTAPSTNWINKNVRFKKIIILLKKVKNCISRINIFKH